MNIIQQSPTTISICSICRGEPMNAVGLDCNHIFCYLCIKSVAETTGACPLCRKEIPIEFNFQKHQVHGATRMPSSKTGFYWFYEGFNGWWMFDADTNNQLEDAYSKGEKSLEKLIAGHFYIIDLNKMTQRRGIGDSRERKIIRSTLDQVENILGLSGLRCDDLRDYIDMLKSADITE